MTLHICYTQRGKEQGIFFSPHPHTLPGLSPINIPTLPAFQHLPPQGFLQAIPSTPNRHLYTSWNHHIYQSTVLCRSAPSPFPSSTSTPHLPQDNHLLDISQPTFPYWLFISSHTNIIIWFSLHNIKGDSSYRSMTNKNYKHYLWKKKYQTLVLIICFHKKICNLQWKKNVWTKYLDHFRILIYILYLKNEEKDQILCRKNGHFIKI